MQPEPMARAPAAPARTHRRTGAAQRPPAPAVQRRAVAGWAGLAALALAGCADVAVERAAYDAIQMQHRPRPGALPAGAPTRPAGAPMGDFEAYRRERERLLGRDDPASAAESASAADAASSSTAASAPER